MTAVQTASQVNKHSGVQKFKNQIGEQKRPILLQSHNPKERLQHIPTLSGDKHVHRRQLTNTPAAAGTSMIQLRRKSVSVTSYTYRTT